VVAGRAGGIPLQLQDGSGGFLVESVEECAMRTSALLADAELRQDMGRSGREHVRDRFLLPRLLADELRVYGSVLDASPNRSVHLGVAVDGSRDPVCGMEVDADVARVLELDGREHFFCSQTCEDEFARDPDRFLRARR
jgi:trehalose synthase